MTRSTIKVPPERVRTAEQILEGVTVIKGYAWVACYNCGGSGTYPSSMTPPGMCRLYCWAKPHTDPLAQAMGAPPPAKSLDDPTYGKRPTKVETFVKRAQARDRAAYRREVQEELDRPAREAAALEQREREHGWALEEEARREAERQRKAVSQWVGALGKRLEIEGTVERVRKFTQRAYMSSYDVTRYTITVRDAAGSVLMYFSDYSETEGARVKLRGTVKQHGEYQGERQTQLQRVKVLEAEEVQS